MNEVTAIINRQALRYNFQRLRKLVPISKLIVVVKANAYGHGLLGVTKALPNADAFAVARLNEALKLRLGGITQPILLLNGFFSKDDLFTIMSEKIQTTIHNLEQLKILEALKLSEPIVVWMKIDTGMHRLGIQLDQAEEFYQRLIKCKNVKYPVNIISHLARSDDPMCNLTKQQINLFSNFCKGKSGLRSIAASCGILFWSKSHFDCVRPGIILYGISPINNVSTLEEKKNGLELGFKPVMSLTSKLIAVRKHKFGEPVGYGETWFSKRNTNLGIVAIGYGDGYPYTAPSGTPVLINNREVNIVGRVSMDMICVDLGPQIQDKIGDSVILWGNGLPVERIAHITKTSAYELVTRLTSRVVIHYFG